MERTLIRVSDVSKKYIIAHKAENTAVRAGQMTLRDEIVATFKNLLKKRKGSIFQKKEEFWALRDINFEVKEGDAVGLIGHNGAGKSTLLKLLSRITDPTTGEIEMNGRVASLLEVATGFHPELSGRENIFLKGAILGMKHSEIKASFDEIVEFAEVSRFLDTPVKRYSSGMYVKLGFAVSAHLNPEILIVDEVLAVGDAQFQRKCVNKMQSILNAEGRTILFVSHNLSLIRTLCKNAIIMKAGHIIAAGPVDRTVEEYAKMMENADGASLADRTDRRGKGGMRIMRVDVKADVEGPLITGQSAEFAVQVDRLLPQSECMLYILDKYDNIVSSFNSGLYSPVDKTHEFDHPTFLCQVNELPLVQGRYRVDLHVRTQDGIQDEVVNACKFDVETGTYQQRMHPPFGGGGSVLIPHSWQVPRP